jgi:hypothetical protein
VSDNPEDNQYKFKFLKFSLHNFIWPRVDDIQVVEKDYIFYDPITMIGLGTMTISENDRQKIITKCKELKRLFQ